MPSLSSRRGLVISVVLVAVVLAALDLMRHDSFLRSAFGERGADHRHPGLERLERSRLPIFAPRRP